MSLNKLFSKLNNMKTLNIPLEDKEYKALSKAKGNKTWHNFIMELAKGDEKDND